MAMCATCQAKYNQYAGLKGQLSNALDYNEECKSKTLETKSELSSVIISGVGIDKDDTTNITRYLGLISNGLSTLITQCSHEMNRIQGSCPGSDHYKSKTTLDSEIE